MVIDIIAALLIGYGFYSGFRKGIIKTVFGVISLIVGIVAALKISPIVIGVLQSFLPLKASIVFIIGFVLTFFLVMLLIRVIGSKIESAFKAVQLNSVNKIMGGVLLGFVFALMLGYMIFGINKLDLISPEAKSSSISYPVLASLPAKSNKMAESLKPVFNGFWEKMMEAMDTIKEEGEKMTDSEEEDE